MLYPLPSKELGRINDVPLSRRVIVLVTDGEDNDSHLDINQAIEIAQRNASLVYVISTNELASSRADSPDAAMKELSEATGGNRFHAEAQSDLKNAFSNMQKELRSQYADRPFTRRLTLPPTAHFTA